MCFPKHLGGEHIWTNVVAACPSCNHHKGGRKLGKCTCILLHIPIQPPASAFYIFGRHLEENSEWEQFIKGMVKKAISLRGLATEIQHHCNLLPA